MMRPDDDLLEVFLCLQPVDFRKGIDGLSALVAGELAMDPFSRRLFVFSNRHRNKVKILYWERNGFCLWQKRLEKERFHWLRSSGEVASLTGRQLNWLLDGYNINAMRPHRELNYSSVI